MDITFQTMVLLTVVAAVAGFVDAMAGGGGLLTIPSMLMANIPPLLTLGTNKLQATAGSLSASITMVKKGLIHPKQVWRSVFACFIGATVGAVAVQLSPPDLLTRVIPFLIALIGLYYLFAPNSGEITSEPRVNKKTWQYGIAPLIGFYDGYLGPGTGMFFALGGIALRGLDMITATANAKILNFTSNVASLVFFVLGGKVHWSVGLMMMLGQMIGASLGAHVAVRGGVKFIRPLIVVMCFAMLAKYVFF